MLRNYLGSSVPQFFRGLGPPRDLGFWAGEVDVVFTLVGRTAVFPAPGHTTHTPTHLPPKPMQGAQKAHPSDTGKTDDKLVHMGCDDRGYGSAPVWGKLRLPGV